MLIILPFFSIINSFSIYNQGIFESARANFSMSFIWVIYFVFHIFRVRESTVLKAFFCISVFIVAVQIIQQFTYPYALFGINTEDDIIEQGLNETAEMRNGLWRFRMHINGYYTVPIIFLMVNWLRKKIDIRLIVYFVLLLISIYLTLTRQVILATLFTIFFSFFTKNFRYISIGFIIALLLYMNYDSLLGDMAEKTNNELNKNNIRLYAALYYWQDSLKEFTTFLFGYGLPGPRGAFYNYVQKLHDLGLHVVDVGFIGIIWRYGLLYVIICFYLLYCLFFKFRRYIPLYIRLFVVYVSVMAIMIFPIGASQVMTMIWPLLLYICDLHINKSQFALITT